MEVRPKIALGIAFAIATSLLLASCGSNAPSIPKACGEIPDYSASGTTVGDEVSGLRAARSDLQLGTSGISAESAALLQAVEAELKSWQQMASDYGSSANAFSTFTLYQMKTGNHLLHAQSTLLRDCSP